MSRVIARDCTIDAPLRVGVLVSGSGSNLQAILDAARDRQRAFIVSAVVSNVEGAGALARARAAGVADVVVEPHKAAAAGPPRTREQFEDAVHRHLIGAGVELVVLAGFMRVLTASFIARWPRRVINVHPALCPAFPGMHAARQALDRGVKITGCTVHLVDAGVDTGPILAQAAVPVLEGDDEATLQARIQIEEHRLLPEVLARVARGAL